MPADPSAAWDSGLIARSNAERGRYAPEFDSDRPPRRPPVPAVVGVSD